MVYVPDLSWGLGNSTGSPTVLWGQTLCDLCPATGGGGVSSSCCTLCTGVDAAESSCDLTGQADA